MNPNSYPRQGNVDTPGLLDDHPLVGTRWASNNGRYVCRVVMGVSRSRDGRLRARLTSDIPGYTTWRLLDGEGETISGHHKIADADPIVETLAQQFEDLGIDAKPIAMALRWPAYDWPGASERHGRPHDEVTLSAVALAAIGHALNDLRALVEQANADQENAWLAAMADAEAASTP